MCQAKQIESLQAEILIANREHEEALKQAEELLTELKALLAVALGDGTERNIITSFKSSS